MAHAKGRPVPRDMVRKWEESALPVQVIESDTRPLGTSVTPTASSASCTTGTGGSGSGSGIHRLGGASKAAMVARTSNTNIRSVFSLTLHLTTMYAVSIYPSACVHPVYAWV